MAWQGIEGHDAVAARFAEGFARGRIAGSFLFIGPPGVGKTTFARGLARSLLCPASRPGLVACGSCASCVQAMAGSHPDIDVVEKPEDRATIPLEAFIGDAEHRMREGLCWRLLLRPALGTRKVAIILDADHLSEEAANCLLKTLEEPPDGAVIILVGTSLERQLPTIRSRCQIVRFRPLAEESVLAILRNETTSGGSPADPELLRSCARNCGGSLQRGRLLLDSQLARFRDRLVSMLSERPLHGVELARETTALVEAAGKDAAPRRARLRIVLGAAIEFYRAGLRHAATGEAPADGAIARQVAAWAAATPSAGREAATALRTSLDALDAIDRNANIAMLIDAWTAVLEEPRLAQPS
ncbi:MAG: AAA family ATPase [Planctomycetia bacterium]|nr:AAA family ATPase [Planctomycetia bacterium]